VHGPTSEPEHGKRGGVEHESGFATTGADESGLTIIGTEFGHGSAISQRNARGVNSGEDADLAGDRGVRGEVPPDCVLAQEVLRLRSSTPFEYSFQLLLRCIGGSLSSMPAVSLKKTSYTT